MLFASGSSVTVMVKVWACGMWSFIKGVDLPEGKKKKKDWRRWQAGMQYRERSEQAMGPRESGRALFRGCFGMTAAMCSRARSQAVPSASFFFGVRIRLGTIFGRFSIIYFRGLGFRIRVRVWVRARVRVWVRVRIGVWVRVSVVLWSL